MATLKALHTYLRLIEDASELKRRVPTTLHPRPIREGLLEMSRLIGIDPAVFKDPQHIAALMGAQRFVMIWGEPSSTEHVARVFDSSRVLLTVLIDPTHFENAGPSQGGPTSGGALRQPAADAAFSRGPAHPTSEPSATQALSSPEPDLRLNSLKPLLSGNLTLTCRLFRALFEHMLGFVSPATAQQGNVLLVSELTGSREHSRSFLSTALFILGAEVDRDNLLSFMMQQDLIGMPIFEQMLRNRDYCDAFHTFRRLERAFMGPAAAEEAQLRSRLEQFNAQLGGKPCGAWLFEAETQDRTRVDAHWAATDLLDALALTPWGVAVRKAVCADASYSFQSVSILAKHFERFARGETTKEQANQDVADHLLAFARQFCADAPVATACPTPASPPGLAPSSG